MARHAETKSHSDALSPLIATRALLALSVRLPVALFGLASWQNRHDTLRDAHARVAKTVLILHEHALKVFETHRLAIDQVNQRLRTDAHATPSDLFPLLQRLRELDQIAAVTVTDTEGRLWASSLQPVPSPSLSFADRDWFQALLHENVPVFVSRSYTGRQTGVSVFNVASRIGEGAGDAFHGAIAVSVGRAYFERFYATIEPDYTNSVILVRSDGAILARQPATEAAFLPQGGPLIEAVHRDDAGLFTARSSLDGVERIYGFRGVGDWPVFVGFGISTAAALEPWRRNLAAYGAVAALASLALLMLSWMALRQAGRQQQTTLRWQQAAAQLATEMAEREKIEAQLRQAQKMEAVGQLTGGIAHDFNNMLAVIMGNLDLMQRRERIAGTGENRYIEAAVEGARRAASLTQRLLTFSRQQTLSPEPVEPNRLVANMSDLLRRTLGEPVRIETVLADGLWRVHADRNQIESALLNLAVNARDAMDGAGRLTIETANAQLDDHYAAAHVGIPPGQYVMLAVTDTGSGIAPDILDRVFEPFFTTKPVGQGTGLGLSQVYGFARQSSGHVRIYSELGQGTTVRLYLPRFVGEAELGPRGAGNVALPAPAGLGGATVLVVEDEEAVRRVSVAALRELGYEVLEAESAASALLTLDAHPEVALLFTDVVMPDLNGRRLADEAVRRRPDLRVLFTTGYTRSAVVHNATLDAGVTLITKPFSLHDLAMKVRSMLEPVALTGE